METKPKPIQSGLITLWLSTFSLVLLWSVIHPHDLFTWFLEVLPALIGIVALAVVYHKFRFTEMLYWLMLAHAIILMIGGHYTYAEVPLFNWIRDAFHMARNNYDKVGHFAQGFVPALIAREILLRRSALERGKLLSFIVVCICLAISASYELFEWQVAVWTGTAADSFLGSQGDVWDTQSDMLMALIGALAAVLVLSRAHDRALTKV